MAYIIAEPCLGKCEYDCVEVCPVDCIRGPEDNEEAVKPEDPAGKMLFIDPETCIDCGVCEPECPVDAIFEEDLVPEEWKQYIEINAKFFA